ncbi:MAG TPA: DUF2298 domain-containing protein [Thermomicrobiales bacterium]|nr:DUF2298 domain-containing protein [Thermomicrobiales bacterium]
MTMVVTGIRWPTTLASYFDSATSPLNPYNAGFGAYVYGTFPLFLAKAIGFITGDLNYGDAHLPGRWLSALADTGTVMLAFWIARRLFSTAAGLLAALLTALAPLHIQSAHYFTTDSTATFFAVASFAAVLRSTSGQRWRWMILAGICVGLATASKPNLAITAGFLLIPLLENVRTGGPAALGPRGGWRRALALSPAIRLLVAGVVAAVTFRIAQPYAFTGPHIWNISLDPRWTDTLDYWRQIQRGSIDAPPGVQWADRTPLVFILDNLVRWGMGPALGIAALIALTWFGIRMLSERRWPSWWLLAVILWAAFHIAVYGAGLVQAQRYLLPAYPFLIVLAVGWLVTLPVRVREIGWRPSPIVLARLRGALIALVAFGTVVSGVAMTSVYLRGHTRVAASEWIYEHVPPGSVIATEHWDDGLPLGLPGQPVDAYRFAQIPGYDADTEIKLSRLIGRLQQADYVVLSSDRLIETVPRIPDRYPMMRAYYEALQSGELGFELVQSFTSPPTFLGIEFDDRGAEEAFTVYDHPQVRIFRKTDAWSAHAAWQLLDDALGEGGVPRRVIDPSTSQLMLTEAEQREVVEGGTWSEIVDAPSMPTALVVLLWYLALQLAAVPAVLALGRLLSMLPDRGYAVAKLIGLLAIAWGVWLLASLRLVPFGRVSIGAVFVVMLLLALVATWRRWGDALRELRERWRWVVGTEVLFLIAFGGMLWMRAMNPDLWQPGRGGEKPMEMAIFTAVMRSEWFPPYDPWFAEGVLHYYYLGYMPWVALTRVLGITPEIAFNLALPSLFALLVVSVWSAAAALLVASRRRWDIPVSGWRPILLALAAPVLVVLVGNLDFVRRLGRGEWGGEPPPEWAGSLGEVGLVLVGIWRALTVSPELPQDAYWAPSRVIPNTVNEFPYFTFLFGDLHAHVLGMPVVAATVVIAIALATGAMRDTGGADVLATLGGWRQALPLAVLGGFVSGTLLGTNPWDHPPALTLLVAGAAIHLLVSAGFAQPWRSVRDLAIFVATLLVVGRVLYWPFLDRYGALSPEILPAVESTALRDYLTIHGLFLAAVAGYLLVTVSWSAALLWRRGRAGRAMAAVAVLLLIALYVGAFVWGDTRLFLIAGLATSLLAMVGAARLPAHLLIITMTGLALALALSAEVVRFSNDIGRMNLVFKFYLHAWQVLGIAAAASIVLVIAGGGRLRSRRVPGGFLAAMRGVWLMIVAVLLAGALAYPALATATRLGDRIAPISPTLDGLAYMQHAEFTEGPSGGEPSVVSAASDRAAIAWLREQVQGTPVILEAQLPAYRWGGRISSTTGLPTVLGWTWHEIQQRPGHGPIVDQRVSDVATIYGSPHGLEAVEPLLERYGVKLIIVGDLERALYPASALDKFSEAAEEGQLDVVYEANGVTIYAMPGYQGPSAGAKGLMAASSLR